MSNRPVFFLRSSGGIFLKVTDDQVTEICLFTSRSSCEHYPLDVRSLIGKVQTFSLKETEEVQFQKAQTDFLLGVGIIEATALLLPPDTPQQVERAAMVAQAIEEDLHF